MKILPRLGKLLPNKTISNPQLSALLCKQEAAALSFIITTKDTKKMSF